LSSCDGCSSKTQALYRIDIHGCIDERVPRFEALLMSAWRHLCTQASACTGPGDWQPAPRCLAHIFCTRVIVYASIKVVTRNCHTHVSHMLNISVKARCHQQRLSLMLSSIPFHLCTTFNGVCLSFLCSILCPAHLIWHRAFFGCFRVSCRF